MAAYNCPVCSVNNEPAGQKFDRDYYQCAGCASLYTQELPQAGMVGGTGQEDRNAVNSVRLEVLRHLGVVTLLDYGCGNGQLVQAAGTAGFLATGYDPFNPTYALKPAGAFDGVTLIEVVEHLYHPFAELDFVRARLAPEGIVYVETSFADFTPLAAPYVDPRIGHHVIFSFHGLDQSMAEKGLVLRAALNRNVRVYQMRHSAGKLA